MSLNQVTMLGRMGDKPQLRSTQSGQQVANGSLATENKWRDKESGEQRKDTEWHRLVWWDDAAVNAERWLGKGTLVMITGRLVYNEWEDKGGVKRRDAQIRVQWWEKCADPRGAEDDRGAGGHGRDDYRRPAAQPQEEPGSGWGEPDDSDVPF